MSTIISLLLELQLLFLIIVFIKIILPLLNSFIVEFIDVFSMVYIGKLPQKSRNFSGKADRNGTPSTLQALSVVVI